MGEGDAPGGAHQQLHAQVLFQCVDAPAHQRRRYPFSLGSRRQAATGGHRDEGFQRFEFVHGGSLGPQRRSLYKVADLGVAIPQLPQ